MPRATSWLTERLTRAAPGAGTRATGPGPETGLAIRIEWADGTHALTGFTLRARAARRQLRSTAAYWAGTMHGPTAMTIVEVSRHDWQLHAGRRGCRSPSCPSVPAAVMFEMFDR